MAQVTATDVSKLRKSTGAGMMDCKNALVEADGDFEKAIEIIRKKGQAIANKRADRDASEGCVIAKTTEAENRGVIVALNCETDFVAKNADYIAFVNEIAEKALAEMPSGLDELKALSINNRKIEDLVTDRIGAIGEKLELSYYAAIEAPLVMAYIHPGNKLGTLVGFNKASVETQVAKDIAMQIAAMNPVAVDKSDVSQKTIDKELEIGKDQAILEGKPADLAEKIAVGKLNKFFKESTLLNQDFIKDSKITVKQYLQQADKELSVTGFMRFTLNV